MAKKKDVLNIAIDFDGTCVSHEYPKVGKDIGAVPVLKELVNLGHKLILFTMRDGQELRDAVEWFKQNDIKLYGVQYNPTQQHWTKSNKCYANLYIDDAALGCPLIYEDGVDRPYVDWKRVREMIIESKKEKTLEDMQMEKFDKYDWAHFHDVILEVSNKQLSQEQLEKAFRLLPEDIKEDAYRWGLSDTPVRDNIYVHYKELNKSINNFDKLNNERN
jgi:hydroxymethylpyrimidine pyrophosphatase-like HAD family hydrolase